MGLGLAGVGTLPRGRGWVGGEDVEGLTLAQRLEAPMVYRWKPQGKAWRVGNGHFCLGVAYITADEARHRLNDVFGVEGWWPKFTTLTEYCYTEEPTPGKTRQVCVVAMNCDITVRLADGSEVSKGDTGSSRSDTIEDARKGAYSDSLKRAASMFGVGYFLESIRNQERPCKVNDRGYFVAWEDAGESNPEIERELKQIADSFVFDFAIPIEKIEAWVGPRETWNSQTLESFRSHHQKLTAKRSELKKVSPSREETGPTESDPSPSPPAQIVNQAPPEWLQAYPRLRDDTKAMLYRAEGFGVSWRDLEIEFQKKLPHLSKDEVRQALNSLKQPLKREAV